MKEIFKKAKDLLAENKLEEAIKLIKNLSAEIKKNIVKCPGCLKETYIYKSDKQIHAECPHCGAMWGKNTVENNNLLKSQEIIMNKITKKDVLAKLWELWRKGDEDVDAFTINSFDATGFLKDTLCKKLGLLPTEEKLEKTEEKQENLEQQSKKYNFVINKIKYYKEIEGKPHQEAVGLALKDAREYIVADTEVVQKSDNELTRDDILEVMLQMFKKNEESQYITRHNIAKFETTGQIDENVLKIIYKRAGKDYYSLSKKDKKDGDFDFMSHIMDYESGGLDEPSTLKLFQHIVDNGHYKWLQGHYGRTAQRLIDAGLVKPPKPIKKAEEKDDEDKKDEDKEKDKKDLKPAEVNPPMPIEGSTKFFEKEAACLSGKNLDKAVPTSLKVTKPATRDVNLALRAQKFSNVAAPKAPKAPKPSVSKSEDEEYPIVLKFEDGFVLIKSEDEFKNIEEEIKKMSPDAQKWIGEKISILRHEGYPQKQAIAIAHSMARKKGHSVPKK